MRHAHFSKRVFCGGVVLGVVGALVLSEFMVAYHGAAPLATGGTSDSHPRLVPAHVITAATSASEAAAAPLLLPPESADCPDAAPSREQTLEEQLAKQPEDADSPFPPSSTVVCHMHNDGSEFCVYEDVCLDVQTPELMDSNLVMFNTDIRQQLEGDDFWGSSNTPQARASRSVELEEADDIVVLAGIGAGGRHWPTKELGGSTEASSALAQAARERRAARNKRRQARTQWSRASVVDAVKLGDVGSHDVIHGDIRGGVGRRPHVAPADGAAPVKLTPPSEGLPREFGGSYDGSIIWMDSLYTGRTLIGGYHIWADSMITTFGTAGVVLSNTTRGLGLPGVRTLFVGANHVSDVEEAWRKGGHFHNHAGRWIKGALLSYLTHITHGVPPYYGHTNEEAEPAPATFPHFEEAAAHMQRLRKAVCAAPAPGAAAAAANSTAGNPQELDEMALWPLDAYHACKDALTAFFAANPGHALPFQWLTAAETGYSGGDIGTETDVPNAAHQTGVRVAFTARDLPKPITLDALLLPKAFTALANTHAHSYDMEAGKKPGHGKEHVPKTPPGPLPAAAAVPHAAGMAAWPTPQSKLRLCARKVIVPGARYSLIGGPGDGHYMRHWAERQLGVAYLTDHLERPPLRVVVVDRGVKPNEDILGTRPRFIVNKPEVEAVLKKYALEYEWLTDSDVGGWGFEEQARAHAKATILITIHGAGMVNCAFLPRRAAVIELFPYKAYCPIYSRLVTYAGAHVLPVWSRIPGPNLDFFYMGGVPPEKKEEEQQRVYELCSPLGFTTASARAVCWYNVIRQAIVVPIPEFEARLLDAIELVGYHVYPRGSTLTALNGLPQGAPPPLYTPDSSYFTNRSWVPCPPSFPGVDTCRAALAAEGSGLPGMSGPPV